MGDGRFWCEGCRRRVSVTAGTIFHRTRTPLTVWFAVAWYMTSAKSGVLGQNAPPAPRLRLVPDRLDHAPPLPDGDGAAWA